MQRLFQVLFTCLIIINSVKASNGFELEGESQLFIKNNSSNTIDIYMKYFPTIPFSNHTVECSLNQNQSNQFTVVNQGLGYFDINIGEKYVRYLSGPGAQTIILIHTNDSVSFSGDFSEINNILYKNSGTFYSTHEFEMELINCTAIPSFTFEKFIKNLDITERNIIDKLNKRYSMLPEWFIDFEKQRIKINKNSFAIGHISKERRMNSLLFEVPENYADSFLIGINLNDELYWATTFNTLVYNGIGQNFSPYYFKNYDTLNTDYFHSMLTYVKDNYSVNFSSYLISIYLTFRINRNPNSIDHEWINLVSLDNYRDIVEEFHLNKLSQGNPFIDIPDFKLVSNDGRNSILSKVLKNEEKQVFFWTTSCKACLIKLKSVSEEGEQNNSIGKIRICIASDYSRFKSICEELNLENMYWLDANDSELLKKTLHLNSFPAIFESKGLHLKRWYKQ